MSQAVAKPSDEVAEMRRCAAKGYTLMEGTEGMREAGVTYLPKFKAEAQEDYTARLNSSWLFNGYAKTVYDMVGRVFGTPVELQDNPPQQLVDWCSNIDMAGRDLSSFAKEVFTDALSGPGVSYVMMDAPRRDGTVSVDQATRANLRPYLISLSVEDVLGWRAETINNVMTLTQFRLMECVNEPDPKDEFGMIEVDQVRVLDLTESGRVQVRLFRKKEGSETAEWVLYGDPILTDMTEITVAPCYLRRDDFMTGEPPLSDLADINIAHWQSQSDQRNILHFARVPILFGAGIAEDKIVVGAGRMVLADDPGAKLGWVEHNGAAMEAGRQDLKDLEFQMEHFGLQLLTPRQSAQSATGEAFDAAKETSQLAMMADGLRDCMEQVIGWMCKYGGVDYTPSVKVNDDFGTAMFTAQEFMALAQAWRDGGISHQTFLEESVRRGFLRSDLDVAQEVKQIEADQTARVDAAGYTIPGSTGITGGMPNNAAGMAA